MNPWIPAFVVAATVTLVSTPLLRRLALRIDLVDRPAARKIHTVPVPYLGGVAIAFGVLAGLAATSGLDWRAGVLALAAGAVGAAGLLDDDRQLRASTRLGVETVAALAAAGTGLRLEATGAAPVDAALTVVWIVGLTNAQNLLDNMDGLAAGVAAAIAGCTLILAAGGDARWVPALAAAVVGASLAFLVFNVHPARVFMGDAGSLFLGYLLAVTTLGATQPLAWRPGVAVPLLLCAVPIADTTTVVAGRLRHGLRIAQGGKDHLSHRLAALGPSPSAAVAVLVTVALAAGALGAFAGRADLPLRLAAALGAALLGLLLLFALHPAVYEGPSVVLPSRMRAGAAVAIVVGVVAAGAGFAPIGAGHRLVPVSRAAGPGAHAPEGTLPATTLERGIPEGEPRRVPPLAFLATALGGLGAALLLVARRRKPNHPDEEKVIDVRTVMSGSTSPARPPSGVPAERR